jgi:type II secretory pathway component PulF
MAGLGASLSAFEATTRQAGGRTPALTAMVVGWHLPWLLAGLVVACAAGAVGLGRRRHPAARWLLIAAVALPVVGAPIFLVAMYLPIFSLADAIR